MSEACRENIKKFNIKQSVSKFNELVTGLIDESKTNKIEFSQQALSYDEARKKLKALYVCSFDFASQRLRFAFDRLCKKRNPKDILVVGFHFLKFISYILTIPIRWIFYKNVFG